MAVASAWGSDVVVEERAEVSVGVCDPVDRGAIDGRHGVGGVGGAERMADDRDAIDAGLYGARLHEPADRSCPNRSVVGCPIGRPG